MEQAIELARRFHAGQTDKAGRPYLEHVLRVADGVDAPDEKLVAVMHDLLEDTILDSTDLFCAGCPPHVLLAVEDITHLAGESYESYLRRVASNPLALAVKRADISDNASEDRLRLLDPEDAGRLREKYRHARSLLEEFSAAPVISEPSQRERGAQFAALGTPTSSELVCNTFWCGRCGRPAGTLTLFSDAPTLLEERHALLFTQTLVGSSTGRVDDEKAVQTAIAKRDAAFLGRLDHELVPFWCLRCEKVYCNAHWVHWVEFDDGFYDCDRGRCPEGHVRTLSD
ncbi:MAG: hypothetical protein FWC87_10795 [Acidimicrobiaceae bacterium]|nr:hypothetical protein [Acidimicrobiaceae bacterium]